MQTSNDCVYICAIIEDGFGCATEAHFSLSQGRSSLIMRLWHRSNECGICGSGVVCRDWWMMRAVSFKASLGVPLGYPRAFQQRSVLVVGARARDRGRATRVARRRRQVRRRDAARMRGRRVARRPVRHEIQALRWRVHHVMTRRHAAVCRQYA